MMGMKEWFMDRQMKKMSNEEKQTMMDTMMDKFFASMGPEDKKKMMSTMMPKMMDNMFKGMSSKEKQEIMSTMMPQMMENMFDGMNSQDKQGIMMAMMPQMMGQMFGGGSSSSKSKDINLSKSKNKDLGKDEKNIGKDEMGPSMDMMKMCMGDNEPPWISMEKAFHRAMSATEYSMLSTEEINSVFQDWMNKTNEKVLSLIQNTSDLKVIAEELNLSKKSVYFILCKLAQQGNIELNVKKK